MQADTGGGFPPAWKPAEGDILKGVVVGRDQFEGTGKIPGCEVLEIREHGTDEVFALFIRNVVLKRLVTKWEPQVGEFVIVRYIGLATDEKTKLWALAVARDKSAQPPDPTTDGDAVKAVH